MVLVVNSKSMNRMLYATVCYMFIMGFLIHDLDLPIGIMAVLDVAVFFALLYSMRFWSSRLSRIEAYSIVTMCVGLFIVAIIHALWTRVSPLLLLDGVRNGFRGMTTFVVTVCLVQKGTTKRIVRLIERFFRINVIVCTIQYFLLGITQDSCNGLFGAGKMNSWTNLMLCVISVYYISQYMNRLISLRNVVINVIFCLYIAILAELKFFFFELILIALMLILLEKPSLRTIILCVVGTVVLSAMVAVFISFWEDRSMFTLEGIRRYLDIKNRSYGYSSVGDWGRIGGIANATKRFFSKDLNLFGMGVGYCGYDTPFYNRYGWLHYNWFSYISIFMEQGWVGIIGYLAFFAVNILILRNKKKSAKTAESKTIYDVSIVMSALGMVLMFYNSTVTGYPAFFLFLLMGLAYRYELDEGVIVAEKTSVEQAWW